MGSVGVFSCQIFLIRIQKKIGSRNLFFCAILFVSKVNEMGEGTPRQKEVNSIKIWEGTQDVVLYR